MRLFLHGLVASTAKRNIIPACRNGTDTMRAAALLLLLIACPLGSVSAQEIPTKTIKIYNNSRTDTIYPVLSAYIGHVDLWMQAQFKVSDVNKQTFCNVDLESKSCTTQSGVPRLYRAYINPEKGVAPGEFVSITVPFYTQLLPTTPATLGTLSGQFIDWWNAQRIFFYVGKTALTGAYNYNGADNAGKPVPPTPVNPVGGAAVPSCASGNKYTCETPTLVYYKNLFPTGSIPFDFGEYTFAAAEGPPPGGLLKVGDPLRINLKTINFNVSAVDGVYLPVAMAVPGGAGPDSRKYLGSTASMETFKATLSAFSDNNASWPYYHPSYFSKARPISAEPTPQDGDQPYNAVRIPSENVVFAETYKVPAPAPPVVSSNTNGTPMLGKAAQAVVDLWKRCTANSSDGSDTCKKIRDVSDFFKRNYQETCGKGSSVPDQPTMLRQVSGWAEFPDCAQALVKTPGYDRVIKEYCELQYNYLLGAPPADIFNPYARLVHETLKSNAYAFSIDDKAAFLSVPGDELVITIGGPVGIPEGYQQYDLPAAATIAKFCH